MFVDDLDLPAGRVSEAAQRVIERAALESRRRGHSELTGDHLFVALAQVEWNLFAEVMRAVDLNPQAIVIEVEQVLAALPAVEGADVRVSGDAKLLARLALHRATRGGHQAIEPADLFAALLDDAHGAPASVFRAHGVDANDVATRLSVLLRDLGVRDEKLLKRFELPPYLKQFATNLNLLARQDKVPPVFGRDQEIQQVLEISVRTNMRSLKYDLNPPATNGRAPSDAVRSSTVGTASLRCLGRQFHRRSDARAAPEDEFPSTHTDARRRSRETGRWHEERQWRPLGSCRGNTKHPEGEHCRQKFDDVDGCQVRRQHHADFTLYMAAPVMADLPAERRNPLPGVFIPPETSWPGQSRGLHRPSTLPLASQRRKSKGTTSVWASEHSCSSLSQQARRAFRVE